MQKQCATIHFIRWILLVFIFTSLSTPLFSQRITVSGVVSDVSGETMIGATVTLENTQRGTITDLNGRFTMSDVPSDGRLLVSMVGFVSVRVNIDGKNTVNVTLTEDVKVLDDVVVIGYGSVKKRDITGAISSVSSETIGAQSAVSLFDAIQGQVAGVGITSGSGAPGGGSNVRVRGTATFEGGAKPLYVVDGVIYEDIDDLNPDDIASLEVLKDAASSAIYGSRSANGVFMITTKQGDKTKTQLNVRYLKSFSNFSRKMPKANAAERKFYDSVRREVSGIRNDQVYGYTITDSLAYFTNQDQDLQDLLFRTSIRDEISLSASGASDAFKYYISTGYLNDEGIVVNSNYNRLTARVNAEYSPNRKLTLGSKLFLSLSHTDGISESGVLNQALERIPYWAIFNPDGSYVQNILNRRNPLAVAMTDIDKDQRYTLTFYEYLTYEFNRNLTFNTNIQANYSNQRQQNFRPQPQLNSTERTTGIDNTSLRFGWTNENYFSYKNTFGSNHNVDAMVGTSFQTTNREYVRLMGLDYTTDALYSLNAASGFDTKGSYTRFSENRMASFFARGGYNYKGTYLFNANIRYDGSSRFGKNNRWGMFPSASAAWRFSDEAFTGSLKPFLTDGKFRVSYGVTGNESIGDFVGMLLYSPNFIYDNIAGIGASNLAYDDLSWEETSQFNLGIDLSFNKNRIRIVADYYMKHTNKLLNRVELPKETGFSTIYKNVGAMANEGFEFSLGLNLLQKRNFKWDVDFNWATNNSRITKISDGIPFYKGTDEAIFVQEGGRLGEFYGYKYLGVFAYDESNAFTDNWERLTPVFDEQGVFKHYTLGGASYTGTVNQKLASNGDVLLGGDVDFEDTNGDGRIDVLDKALIGCAQPDFFGGLSTTLTYKRFTLSASLYYSIGGKIYNQAEAKRNLFRQDGTTPSPHAIHNMWTRQGDQAIYPAPIVSEHNTLAPNNFYLEDASYIKLQNLRLEYAMSSTVLKKTFLRSARFHVYGKNLLTFTNYTGYDPEFADFSDPLVMGIDTNRYPRKREYGFGLSVGF